MRTTRFSIVNLQRSVDELVKISLVNKNTVKLNSIACFLFPSLGKGHESEIKH